MKESKKSVVMSETRLRRSTTAGHKGSFPTGYPFSCIVKKRRFKAVFHDVSITGVPIGVRCVGGVSSVGLCLSSHALRSSHDVTCSAIRIACSGFRPARVRYGVKFMRKTYLAIVAGRAIWKIVLRTREIGTMGDSATYTMSSFFTGKRCAAIRPRPSFHEKTYRIGF